MTKTILQHTMHLPCEVWYMILQHLDAESKRSAARVCSVWFDILLSPRMWTTGVVPLPATDSHLMRRRRVTGVRVESAFDVDEVPDSVLRLESRNTNYSAIMSIVHCRGLNNVTHLQITGSAEMTDRAVAIMVKNMKRLVSVTFEECCRIRASSLEHLATLEQLRYLRITNDNIYNRDYVFHSVGSYNAFSYDGIVNFMTKTPQSLTVFDFGYSPSVLITGHPDVKICNLYVKTQDTIWKDLWALHYIAQFSGKYEGKTVYLQFIHEAIVHSSVEILKEQ